MAIAVSHHRYRGPWTYDQVQQFPADGLRYELVNGELLVSPAPTPLHQLCAFNLAVLLRAACPDHLCVLPAAVDWYVDESTCFEPDVVVVGRDQLTLPRIEETPVLAAEVLSPSTRLHDLDLKRRAYAASGLHWYWIVDPDEPSLCVLRLVDGRYAERAAVTADERCTISEPFPVSLIPSQLLR